VIIQAVSSGQQQQETRDVCILKDSCKSVRPPSKVGGLVRRILQQGALSNISNPSRFLPHLDLTSDPEHHMIRILFELVENPTRSSNKYTKRNCSTQQSPVHWNRISPSISSVYHPSWAHLLMTSARVPSRSCPRWPCNYFSLKNAFRKRNEGHALISLPCDKFSRDISYFHPSRSTRPREAKLKLGWRHWAEKRQKSVSFLPSLLSRGNVHSTVMGSIA